MNSHNPYAAPAARVADGAEGSQFSLALRVVRAFAVAGNVILLLVDVFAQFSWRLLNPNHVPISVILLVVAVTSVVALTSGLAPRLMFWATLLMNGAVAGTLLVAFLFTAPFRGPADKMMLVLLIPFLLTCVAIGWLHTERRAASSRRL